MLSTESSPLLFELSQLNSEQALIAQNEHALWGLRELSFLGAAVDQQSTQMQKNILFLHEFAKLNSEFITQTGSPLTPLKGLSLLGQIYGKNLNRSMTDMDFYTKLPESVFAKILLNLGYEPVIEKKWRFNQHKYLFRKQHALTEIVCEVHTDLIPSSAPFPWQMSEEGFLAKDEEFLYLCYHWGEQHTCLKLFWLFDLYFYTQKYPLPSEALWEKAQRLKITSSLLAAHWALQNCFNVTLLQNEKHRNHWKSYFFQRLLVPSNLVHLHNRRSAYLLLKHLLKDQIQKLLTYNLLWLRYKYL